MNLNLKYIHIGDGRFVADTGDGEFVDLGQSSTKMIKYTYGESFEPELGWEISSEQLYKDCEPKIMEEFYKNKLKK
tara:strand:+ start:7601 stop:7828 length:228 start_codon:yes stop_codon:yes gene_type:complete